MVKRDTVPGGMHSTHVEDVEKTLDSVLPKQASSSTILPGKKTRQPTIWRAITSTFGGYFAVGGALKLCYDVLTMLLPQILR